MTEAMCYLKGNRMLNVTFARQFRFLLSQAMESQTACPEIMLCIYQSFPCYSYETNTALVKWYMSWVTSTVRRTLW
jgi:hypothetical protein